MPNYPGRGPFDALPVDEQTEVRRYSQIVVNGEEYNYHLRGCYVYFRIGSGPLRTAGAMLTLRQGGLCDAYAVVNAPFENLTLTLIGASLPEEEAYLRVTEHHAVTQRFTK